MEIYFQKIKGKHLLMGIPVLGYIVTGVTVLPFQLAAFIVIKPWSLWMYRKISYYFSLIMYWHSIFLVLWWSNTGIEISMDSKDLSNKFGQEHSIFLANHRYENETFISMSVWNYFRAVGNLRYFIKEELQYLPMAGWLWKLQEHIFVKRSFNNDKQIVEDEVQSLIKHSDAFTIGLFPEGTRFTEEKHKVSMSVAKVKGFPQLKYHLLPRTKGFVTCIKTLKKGNQFGLPVVIYDALFVMESQNGKGNAFSILDLLEGNGPSVKLLIRRYPLENVPEDETKCAQWLHTIFHEKDGLMENCVKTGSFIKADSKNTIQNDLKGFQVTKVTKPLSVLVFIGSLNMVCSLGVLAKVASVLGSGDVIQLTIFLITTLLGNMLFHTLTASTETQKGSSYGQISDKVQK